MEPVTALIGLASNAIGGIFSFLSVDRQASVADHQISADLKAKQSYFDAWLQSVLSQERTALAGYRYGADINWNDDQVQRDRVFYNYQSAVALRGALVAVAGTALLGLAVYAALKES